MMLWKLYYIGQKKTIDIFGNNMDNGEIFKLIGLKDIK